MTPADVFLQHGILGAVVVILLGVVGFLFRDLRAAQATYLKNIEDLQNRRLTELTAASDARAKDAQANAERLVKLTTEVTEAFVSNASANREQAEAMRGLRDASRELAEEVRAVRRQR